MSNVTQLRPKKRPLQLHCSACGAQAEAACDCGVGYMSASEFAAKAAAEHPEMSNRAIAEMTGVGKDTVRRARQSGGANEPPQTRTGRDGKQHPTERKPTTRRTTEQTAEIDSGITWSKQNEEIWDYQIAARIAGERTGFPELDKHGYPSPAVIWEQVKVAAAIMAFKRWLELAGDETLDDMSKELMADVERWEAEVIAEEKVEEATKVKREQAAPLDDVADPYVDLPPVVLPERKEDAPEPSNEAAITEMKLRAERFGYRVRRRGERFHLTGEEGNGFSGYIDGVNDALDAIESNLDPWFTMKLGVPAKEVADIISKVGGTKEFDAKFQAGLSAPIADWLVAMRQKYPDTFNDEAWHGSCGPLAIDKLAKHDFSDLQREFEAWHEERFSEFAT
jgi:hypothetical protein